jgi:competence protein ComEC
LRRDAYLPASLGFAALALSLANPLVLWDVSFQLSFFATLGLALFAEPLQKRFRLRPENLPSTVNSHSPILKLLNKAVIFLIEPLTVTLAALVFTLPLTMLYFGQVSPVILLVNLLIVPVQPVLLLVGGAAALLAGVFEPLAQVLFWLTMLPLSWTIEIVRIFGRIATIEVFISGNLVAAFFIVLVGAALIRASRPWWSIGVMGWLRRRTVVSATGVSAVGIIVLIGALALSRPDGRLHIWLLEMGGSNAVLIQTPRGAQMLIDGGRFPSRLLTALGDRMPFTDRTLEVVFLTQPDEMQFGALRPVLERYTPGVIISNGQPNLGAAWTALQTQVNAYPQVTALAGYTVETSDGVKIEALNPQHTPALGTPLDEAVLVLRLTYGEASFLLVSDLNREGQQALVDSGYDLRSTVLQIPSRVDAAFLDVVQAPVLVTQVEEANPDELAKLGEVSIYRTDTGGTIHLSTDGKELWISQAGR